jgi:hypothetical protein
VGDAASIAFAKLLHPLEGDGDAECQCCFGDEHAVSLGKDIGMVPRLQLVPAINRSIWFVVERIIFSAETA